ncbi:MAG: sigma-70 family RNA polymerase sigma factor [Gemmatimonadaceae bacterium]|nr:sigma-70 family RNA polymerase sigma factor [Gemmatimonadaceae bacterium]
MQHSIVGNNARLLALVPADMTALAFEAEFRAAFAARFSEVYRVVDRYLGDASLASDIAQETFVRLYRRGSMPNDLRSWLVSVALNQARDEQRRTARRLRLLRKRTPDVHMGDAAPSPEEDVLSAERRMLVRRALEKLPPRDRALLLLREEGYSYREVAVALDMVETSVGTLLARAKVAFRHAYESMQHSPPTRISDAEP